MNVLLVSHLTKTVVSACGLARHIHQARPPCRLQAVLPLHQWSPKRAGLSPGRSVQCRNRIW